VSLPLADLLDPMQKSFVQTHEVKPALFAVGLFNDADRTEEVWRRNIMAYPTKHMDAHIGLVYGYQLFLRTSAYKIQTPGNYPEESIQQI
jgi:hypothetical protein